MMMIVVSMMMSLMATRSGHEVEEVEHEVEEVEHEDEHENEDR